MNEKQAGIIFLSALLVVILGILLFYFITDKSPICEEKGYEFNTIQEKTREGYIVCCNYKYKDNIRQRDIYGYYIKHCKGIKLEE